MYSTLHQRMLSSLLVDDVCELVESVRALTYYVELSEVERTAVDTAYTYCGGWSLGTLLKQIDWTAIEDGLQEIGGDSHVVGLPEAVEKLNAL